MADVGIEVAIEASGAVSGGKQAEAALDSVGNAANSAQGYIDSLQQQIEILNVREKEGAKAAAQYVSQLRLGTGATKEQTEQVRRLSAQLYDMQKAGKSSFGGMTQFANQAGYQVQDFLVQVEMGTPILRAFGQQGSQLFSVFSPLLGLAVAMGATIGSVLIPSLADGTTSSEKLDKAIKSLNDTISVGSDGVATFSERMTNLAATNERAAKAQIALAVNQTVEAMNQANNVVGEAIDKVGNWTFVTGSASKALATLDSTAQRTGMTTTQLLTQTDLYGTGLSTLAKSVNNLSKDLGITTDQSLQLTRAFVAFGNNKSAENLQALSDAVNNVNEATGYSNESLVKFAQTVNQSNITSAQYADVMKLLKSALGDVTGVVNNNNEAFQKQQDTLISMSQQLIVAAEAAKGNAREAAILGALYRTGAKEGSAYAEQVRLIAGQLYDLQQQQKSTADTTKQFNQDDDTIEKLKEQIQQAGLYGRELAQLRAEQSLSDKATKSQIESARRYAAGLYDLQQAIQADKLANQQYDRVIQNFVPNVQRAAVQMKALFDLYKSGTITSQQLSVELANMHQQLDPSSVTFAETFNTQFQSVTAGAQNMAASVGTIMGQAVGTLTTQIGQATASMLVMGTSGEDAARQVAQAILGQLISSLVQLGVQWAINAALGETIAAASLAATAASAGVASAAWATPAALASLATLGANSAPAIAAVTGTVASTQSIALASAAVPGFAEGGMAYGPGTGTSDSFTAKLSQGEFVMPAAQTKQYYSDLQSMRSGNYSGSSSGGNNVGVSIVNQTTGTVSSTSQQWITPNKLQVTLMEQVPQIMASELRNEYSDSHSALRASYRLQKNLS